MSNFTNAILSDTEMGYSDDLVVMLVSLLYIQPCCKLGFDATLVGFLSCLVMLILLYNTPLACDIPRNNFQFNILIKH